MSKFAKGYNSKNEKGDNSKKYFHQVINVSSSISCPSLKLLALTFFEISKFLCPNLQRAITKKWFFFNFHQVIYSLFFIS